MCEMCSVILMKLIYAGPSKASGPVEITNTNLSGFQNFQVLSVKLKMLQLLNRAHNINVKVGGPKPLTEVSMHFTNGDLADV